jgi:hypothetical protein
MLFYNLITNTRKAPEERYISSNRKAPSIPGAP